MIQIVIGMLLLFYTSTLTAAEIEPKTTALPSKNQSFTNRNNPQRTPTATPSATPIPTLTAKTLSHPETPDYEAPVKTEIQSASSDSLAKEIELRKSMLEWSRHLGVTCNFCHDTNNFKNDEKATFKVGLKHKSLVRLLNEEVFTERDKGGSLKVVADCYMCHRGFSTPKYKEPPQNLMK
jgi:hypothetical protein